MNKKIIIKYSVVLFVVNNAISFLFAFINSYSSKSGMILPKWYNLLGYLFAFIGMVIVFCELAIEQKERPIQNMLIVGILNWIVNLLFYLIFSRQYFVINLLQIFPILICLLTGYYFRNVYRKVKLYFNQVDK